MQQWRFLSQSSYHSLMIAIDKTLLHIIQESLPSMDFFTIPPSMTPIFNENSNIKEDRQLSHTDARSVTAYHCFLHANKKLRPMTAVASIQPLQVTLHRPPATCHQLVVTELHPAGAGTEQASYATSLPPDYLSCIEFSAPC